MTFFFHLGRNLQKDASTALVRAIQAGKLAAPSIQRAAGAMAPGKFRFLGNLGRGQFNLADKVVGNVGGHAGEMVRKLPAHAYTQPDEGYRGLKSFVDQANKQLPTPSGAPAIAPYVDVNSRGAFQQLANQDIQTPGSLASRWKTWGMSGDPKPFAARVPAMGAKKLMGDLHEGNIGPGGQIIDFTAPGLGWAPSTARRISSDTARLNEYIPGGRDMLANITDPTLKQLAQNKGINNSIRAFYAQSPAQRTAAIQALESLPATMPPPGAPLPTPPTMPRPIQTRRPPAPGQGIMRPKPRGSVPQNQGEPVQLNRVAETNPAFPPLRIRNESSENWMPPVYSSAPPSPGSFHPRSGFGPQDSFGSAPPVPSPRGPRIGRWLGGGLLGGGAIGGGAAIGSGLLNSGSDGAAQPPPPPLPPPLPLSTP